MALYQLIYKSRASRPLDDQELHGLLENARQHNSGKKITGILLYGYGLFIQMLEGDTRSVKTLFHNKIMLDDRHHSLKILREGAVSKRLFTEWSMAFRPYAPDLFRHTAGYVNPDQPSVYGRNLLSPLRTLESMEFLAADVRERGC